MVSHYTEGMAARIEAVIFDYGLVLCGPQDPLAKREMGRLLGVDGPEVEAAYWRFRDAYDLGTLTGEMYWRRVGDALGQEIGDDRLRALIDCDTALWAQPNAPMIAWAERLQRAGVRTAILSNLGDAMEAGLRGRLPWLAAFDHCTFSHRLGVAKPDRAIYEEVLARLQVRAETALFIDDRSVNVEGARRAGLQAILYETHADFLDALQLSGLSAVYAGEVAAQ